MKESTNGEWTGGEKVRDTDSTPLQAGDNKCEEPQLTQKEFEEALVKTIEPPDGGKCAMRRPTDHLLDKLVKELKRSSRV